MEEESVFGDLPIPCTKNDSAILTWGVGMAHGLAGASFGGGASDNRISAPSRSSKDMFSKVKWRRTVSPVLSRKALRMLRLTSESTPDKDLIGSQETFNVIAFCSAVVEHRNATVLPVPPVSNPSIDLMLEP